MTPANPNGTGVCSLCLPLGALAVTDRRRRLLVNNLDLKRSGE